MSPAPLLDVVIPTYRRPDALSRALEALTHQSLATDAFQVIVVDDGSPGESSQVASAFAHRLNLRFDSQANAGPATARNRALRLGSAPLVLFLNDDSIAAPDLLARHLAFHQRHPQAGEALLGLFRFPEELRRDPVTRIAEDRAILFEYPRLLDRQEVSWERCYTCNLSLKRAAIRDVGGFNETFRGAAGEDVEFGIRFLSAGGRIRYDAASIAEHWHPLAVGGLVRAAYVRGLAAPHVVALHPSIHWLSSTDFRVNGQELRTSLRQNVEDLTARASELIAEPEPIGSTALELERIVELLFTGAFSLGVRESPSLDEMLRARATYFAEQARRYQT